MTQLQQETTAPTLIGHHHLGITVCDVEASEAWYGRVLGLVRAFVEPYPGGDGYAVVMTRPGTPLFLGLDHHAEADKTRFDAHRTGLDHVAFGVGARAELDMWAAHLDACGVDRDPVVEGHDPMPHAVINFRDPDGIALEMVWVAS